MNYYGCSKDTINNQLASQDENHSIIMFDNQCIPTLFKDKALIRSSSVNENILTLKVQYSGGCQEHDFTLYGYSLFLKSNPPQAEVYLSHNGNGDMCEAFPQKEIHFDLVPLLDLCRHQFGTGQIVLRIHEPDSTNPITPFVSVSF
jgi:hypothetical protein